MKQLSLAVLAVLLARAAVESSLDAFRQIGIGALLNLFMVAAGCLVVLARRPRVPVLIFSAWVAFISVCVLLSLRSPVRVETIPHALLWLLTYFSAAIIPYYLMHNPRGNRAFISIVIYSSIVPALVGLFQIALNFRNEDFRVEGTFTHPNILAFYIVIVLATLLLKLHVSHQRLSWVRLGLIGYAGLLTLLLFYTKTRGAWIAAVLVLLSYVVFIDRKKLPLLLGVPLLALLPPVRQRLLDATESAEYIGSGVLLNSYEWRKELWHQALSWIEQSPFTGHGGLGTFFHYSGQFFSYVPYTMDGVYAHSVYIELLFEIGVLGPLLFLALLAANAWTFLRALRYDRTYAVMGLTLCTVYAVISYSDNILHYLTFNWYFWILIGTIGARVEMVRAAVKREQIAKTAPGASRSGRRRAAYPIATLRAKKASA